MALAFKTLVRHNNQMQYVNLGWILVQKTKTKTSETKYIRNNKKTGYGLSIRRYLGFSLIFLNLVKCDYVIKYY
jgi:hypothetical protein